MKTIVIPQFYRGPSGQKGLYNRQEVGLARAFAALGCRAVVLYPEPGAKAPRIETPEPNIKICYMPAVAFGVQAFYKSWQILLDEHADAVHVMGDNSLGVPGLYRFCQKHGILFYSQLGALKSTSNHAAVRRVMDLLLRRNLAVYRKTPTYAKTPAVAAELESLGVPCAGLMPVGLDTAIIPSIPNNRTEIRRALKIDEHARVFIFVGRLDPYKQPLDLVPLLQAAPDWYAIIIGRGSLGDELTRRLTDADLLDRCRLIPQLPNEQVHVYYHACDAFVNLNPNEIFGMSLLEAMYAGCPPVARHAPGPDLIIENGISGLLCGTVPELAAALDKTTAAMGHAAQSRVNENFLWQNSAELALTLLDVLDYMEEVPIVTAYKLTDGSTTTRFPMGKTLDDAQPVVETVPGWHCDITGVRRFEDLPQAAQDYVTRLEELVGCKIKYISVGPERDACIVRA